MKRYELAYLENKIKAKAENHTKNNKKNNEGNKEENEEENKGESELELSPNMAMEALAYVKTLRIKSTEDALLFMASANFVNKYIKIDDKVKKLYNFKEDVFYAADILTAGKIPEIICGFHKDEGVGRVLVIQIGKIQFSFHDNRNLDKYRNLSADQTLTWGKVRLQPHSKFVYEETKKYVWSRYNDRKKAEVSEAAERIIKSKKDFRKIMFSKSAVSRQHAKQFPVCLESQLPQTTLSDIASARS